MEWQWDEVTEMKRAFWIFITGALLLLLNLLLSVTLPHLKAIAIGLTSGRQRRGSTRDKRAIL